LVHSTSLLTHVRKQSQPVCHLLGKDWYWWTLEHLERWTDHCEITRNSAENIKSNKLTKCPSIFSPCLDLHVVKGCTMRPVRQMCCVVFFLLTHGTVSHLHLTFVATLIHIWNGVMSDKWSEFNVQRLWLIRRLNLLCITGYAHLQCLT